MGRKPNPTCLYCAKNYRTEDEAKEKHPECYVGHNCRIKRNRLRNPGKVNAKRRQNTAKQKAIKCGLGTAAFEWEASLKTRLGFPP
jgi:hypothetical protein